MTNFVWNLALKELKERICTLLKVSYTREKTASVQKLSPFAKWQQNLSGVSIYAVSENVRAS